MLNTQNVGSVIAADSGPVIVYHLGFQSMLLI